MVTSKQNTAITAWVGISYVYHLHTLLQTVPADIPQEIFDLCINYAVKAHHSLGCRGVTRSDFRWNAKNGKKGLYILELNTQPGMTKTSLVPEQAKYVDLDLQDLCLELIKDASINK